MSESKMPELLEKLHKLDEKTWFRFEFGLPLGPQGLAVEYTTCPGQPRYVRVDAYVKPRDLPKPTMLLWLAEVIQDAVAARKWVYDIYVTNIPSASIQYGPNAGDDTGDIWAESPAEALLAAYVAALEAEETT